MDKPDGGKRLGVKREVRIAEGVSLRCNRVGEPDSLRIAFQFRGVECRERLRLDPSVQNQRYAVRLRGEIINAIERGSFNYATYFPESKNARRFGFALSDKTLGDYFDAYEPIAAGALAASTWEGYKKVIDRHLRPWWALMRARDLTPAEIRARILSVPGITLKTARNVLTPLSVVLTRAVDDDELLANPLDRVNLDSIWPKDRKESGWKPDPFTFEEMLAIFGVFGDDEADYWRTAFGTGMRPSEQIELHWPRVDLAGFKLKVEVARVMGLDGAEVKGPKTDAGNRVVDFTKGAWEALERQWGRTGEAGRHVFLDARYRQPWADDQALRRRWAWGLKKAEVRYRNPYQTRHTFASVLLAAGMPPLRVARLMGHETTEMLTKHYGRWIEQGGDPGTRAALGAFFSHPSPTKGQIVALSL